MWQNYEWDNKVPMTYRYDMNNSKYAPVDTFPSVITMRQAPSLLSPSTGFSVLPPPRGLPTATYGDDKKPGYQMSLYRTNYAGYPFWMPPDAYGSDAPDRPNLLPRTSWIPYPLDVIPPNEVLLAQTEEKKKTTTTEQKSDGKKSMNTKKIMMIVFIILVALLLIAVIYKG